MSITRTATAPANPYIAALTTEPGQDTPVIYTPGSTIRYAFDVDARAWSVAEQDAVRGAWASWERVINLDIRETDDPQQANVLMQISELPEATAAEATAPIDLVDDRDSTGEIAQTVQGTNKTNVRGDALAYITPGGDSYLTLVHEIGHNLGIYHPHSTPTFPGVPDEGETVLGDLAMNQNIWTTLSYNTGYDIQPVTDLSFGNAMTPMTLDIAAAQFAYGARTASTGNDSYALPTANAPGTGWHAIWDTGGRDTITAAGVAGASTIDLRAATLEGAAPGGYVSWATGVAGGFTIAQGVAIENAVGGAGADAITGNGLRNILTGGGGGDRLTGGDGADVLYGEGLPVAFIAGISDQVFRLYQATLGRAPDGAGHNGWSRALFEGDISLAGAADGFTGSPEFQATYGALDDSGFVNLLYRNVLGRDADAGGLRGWLDAMAAGTGRAEVVVGFSESREFRAATAAEATGFAQAHTPQVWSDDVFRLYQATLDRAPDLAGFAGWTASLGSGTAFLTAVEGFTGSTEFQNTYGALDAGGFVDLLYRNVLGRAADAEGRQGWLDFLTAGNSTAQVVQGFSQSAEFITATTGALTAWVRAQGTDDVLTGGAGGDVLAGGLLSDRFVFAPGGGADRVIDLEVWDTLDLTAFGFADIATARAAMTRQDTDVVFEAQGATVTLAGIDLEQIGDAMILV